MGWLLLQIPPFVTKAERHGLGATSHRCTICFRSKAKQFGFFKIHVYTIAHIVCLSNIFESSKHDWHQVIRNHFSSSLRCKSQIKRMNLVCQHHPDISEGCDVPKRCVLGPPNLQYLVVESH